MKNTLSLICALMMILAGASRGAGDSERVVIEPKPRAGMLLNPGKGWSGSGLPDREPPEVRELLGMGVKRFEWSRLEPREGEYHWEEVDQFLEAWGRAGKVVNIGVMCANTHSRAEGGYVTPRWVFEAGAKKIELDLDPRLPTSGTPGHKVAPVFDDPIFLAKLRNFVQAFGKRYDGDPRIAVLDIRSYGNWGEAHMSPFKAPDIAPEKFREHVQMHLDAFKKTQLCVSRNSHLGRFGALKPVFDWAVLEHGVAPRRDGICGNSDGRETAIGLGIAPGVFELFDNYDNMKKYGWWDGIKDKNGMGFTLAECVENGKPTWVDLSRGGASAVRMVRENRELVERLTNRIGYHFELARAAFPKRVDVNGGENAGVNGGKKFEVELTWKNQGVAPIYIPCAVAVALLGADGKPVATAWPDGCNPKQWAPGTATAEKAEVGFAKAGGEQVKAGTYKLGLALTRGKGDAAPYVRLGSELPEAGGWYVLGEVEVQ